MAAEREFARRENQFAKEQEKFNKIKQKLAEKKAKQENKAAKAANWEDWREDKRQANEAARAQRKEEKKERKAAAKALKEFKKVTINLSLKFNYNPILFKEQREQKRALADQNKVLFSFYSDIEEHYITVCPDMFLIKDNKMSRSFQQFKAESITE